MSNEVTGNGIDHLTPPPRGFLRGKLKADQYQRPTDDEVIEHYGRRGSALDTVERDLQNMVASLPASERQLSNLGEVSSDGIERHCEDCAVAIEQSGDDIMKSAHAHSESCRKLAAMIREIAKLQAEKSRQLSEKAKKAAQDLQALSADFMAMKTLDQPGT